MSVTLNNALDYRAIRLLG